MAASRRVFPLGVKEKREKGVRVFFWGMLPMVAEEKRLAAHAVKDALAAFAGVST